MPNSYANLGQSIGNILSRAGGTRSAGPAGRAKGVDAGSSHMLRSAQASKTMADTDKIMYELSQAQKGDNTTAGDIAAGFGVDPGAFDAIQSGATMMPAMPGNQGPAQPVAIPQGMRDKTVDATTLKIMQQLSGGTKTGANASTLMDALGKGQDYGLLSNMISGQQNPVPVARGKAALEGKFPGSGTGAGGKMPAAKVQEVNHLMGLGIPQKVAIEAVHGSPSAKRYTDAYTRVYALNFNEAEANLAGKRAMNVNAEEYLTGAQKKARIPSNIVKTYKNE